MTIKARRRRRDAGISLVIVVILVLITIALFFTSIILNANYKQKARLQKVLKEEISTVLPRRKVAIEKEIQAALEPTGFPAEGEGLPVSAARDRALKVREEYVTKARLDRYPLVKGKDGAKGQEIDETALTNAREGSDLYKAIQWNIPLAAAWVDHYKNRMHQLELELTAAKKQADNRQSVATVIPELPQKRVDEINTRIQAVSTEISNENAAYEARKNKLNEDRAKAEEEIVQELSAFSEYEIRIRNEIRELRRQLEELKVKEVIKHEVSSVHGRIIKPDIPNKTAFITLGSRDRVVPGLKFLAARRGEQGKFFFKGKVEVKKAWVTYSEVSIIEIYDSHAHPITEGDLLVNPLFSTDRPLIVAFAGESRAIRLKYTQDEATRRIMEIGSEVRKGVDLDIDYLIFTETGRAKTRENYPAYMKAVELELPVAEAGDLYRFLGD